MNIRFVVVLYLLTGILTACNSASPKASPSMANPTIAPPTLSFPSPTSTVETLQPTAAPLSPQQAVIDRAFEVISALKVQDMQRLSSYVHPVDGLRFSPYAYVSETNVVFSADQVAIIMADSKSYHWGDYSGSGAPIDMGFPAYYSEFIYDVDFTNAPRLALNQRLGTSTSLDNIFEFYPGAMMVEFNFPGFDPALEGMDWRSLRLVFTQSDGAWYLVGIVHDQWTT